MNNSNQWRVIPMPIHGWAIHDAEGNEIVKDIYDQEVAEKIVREHNNYGALKDALGEMLNRFYPHACDRGAVCAKCGALVAAQLVFNLADKDS